MPSRTPELELKFTATADLSVVDLASGAGIGGVAELPAVDMLALYYDTDDLRLARAGVTLRYRTGDENGACWTVKLPAGGDGSLRNEVSVQEEAGAVPAEAQSLVTVFTRGASLIPVATLRTKRRRWSLRDDEGHELAELMDDRVSVLEGERIRERFRELELEAREVDRDGLERIASVLTNLGAVASPTTPKAVRALGPVAAEPSDLPEPGSVSPRDPVADAVVAALASAVRRLMVHDPYARLNEEEGVHQMRVSARRLRGYLRTFASLLEPDWADHLVDELRWLARTLGEVRDLDVLTLSLKEGAGELSAGLAPFFDVLEERRSIAKEALVEALKSERYLQLLERLIEAAKTPRFADGAKERCRSALPRLVGETWEPLETAVKDLKEAKTDERYHEVRIQAKRVRYAAEAAAPCLGRRVGDEAMKFARGAEEVQNVLGLRQDSVVMREALLEEAARRSDDGSFGLGAGRLVERQEQVIKTCDERFQLVWRAYNRKKNREWLSR